MMKNSHRYKIALLLCFLLASLVLQGQSTPGTKYYFPLIFKNGPAPLYATSYYVQDADPTLMYDLGCELGTRDATTAGVQDSLVILDFAQMWVENGVYGALGFQGPTNNWDWPFYNFEEIKNAAKYYAMGYWVCSSNDNDSQLTLGIGTNSYGFFNQPKENRSQENLRGVAAYFGSNWAYMINELNTWGIQNGYSSQVLFTGAIDIEWSSSINQDGLRLWQSAYVVSGWVNEFDKFDGGSSIYFNYGACTGCYSYVDPNWTYISADYWRIYDVWYVSWGAPPAYVVPEIYSNDGYLASQWATISKYGAVYQASRIVFSGVMTQMQACQQRCQGEDPPLDNTPSQGWGQLVDAVNADPLTVSPLPVWSTDIKWQFK